MQRWVRLLDLGWNAYGSKLYQGGITLCDKPHKLVWVYNIKEGLVTDMLAYHSLFMEEYDALSLGKAFGYGKISSVKLGEHFPTKIYGGVGYKEPILV